MHHQLPVRWPTQKSCGLHTVRRVVRLFLFFSCNRYPNDVVLKIEPIPYFTDIFGEHDTVWQRKNRKTGLVVGVTTNMSLPTSYMVTWAPTRNLSVVGGAIVKSNVENRVLKENLFYLNNTKSFVRFRNLETGPY